MTLSIDEKKSIIAYRIQKSYMCMIESKDNAQLGHWSLAANRLYYSVFYMASALLTDKGFVARTHSGVIHLLGSEFVAKGLLSGQEGHLASRLFSMRQSGDYDDLFDWEEEDVAPLIPKIEELLRKIELLITMK